MGLPAFNAARSLYQSGRHYRHGWTRQARGAIVVPAIPACRNCDDIIDRCAENNWKPAALCRACLIGHCYEDPPPPPPFPDGWDGPPHW